MKNIRKIISRYPLIFLLVCVFITAAVSYSFYVFKGFGFFFHDIGSDTSELYLPVYESIARHLRNGDLSLWDLSYGLGASMYSQNLFHPTMLLLYILGAVFGPEKTGSFLIVIHIIHILLSGLSMYVFLSSFRKLSVNSRILIAYIYSFNGYIVTWGQHYTFGLVTAFLPLILAMTERSFEPFTEDCTDQAGAQKRARHSIIALVILCAVLAMSTYYFSYMIMLAAAFYTVFRLLIMNRPFLTKLKLLVSRGLFMVWGLLIGISYLLPSYLILSQNSSRISSGSGFLQTFISNLCLYTGDYYKTFFRRMVSSSMNGTGSIISDFYGYGNFYEAPQLFMTGLMIILALQFIIFLPKIAKTLRQRIVTVLTMLFLAFLVFIQAGSVMFNGFTYAFSRHIFVILPILALMMAITLDYILQNRKFSVIGGILAAAFTAVICLSSVGKLEYRALKFNCLAILAVTVIMTAGFILYTRPAVSGARLKKLAAAVPVLIAVLAAVQVMGDTRATVHARADRSFAEQRNENLFGADASAVLGYIDKSDNSLYRTERTYVAGSHLMDAASSGYYGFSAYNSTMNRNIIEFLNEMIPEAKLLDSEYRPTYRQIIGRSSFEELLGIKYLITDDPSSDIEGYEPVFSSGSLTVLKDPDVTFAAYYTEAVSEDQFRSLKKSMSSDDIISRVLVLSPTSDDAGAEYTGAAGPLSPDEVSSITIPRASLLMSKPSEEGHLTCSADVPEDGYVFFPVPYEKGWTVKTDGRKAEMLRADFGFIAVKVPAGVHTITLDYHVPWLLPCVIVSLVSLAAFIAFCIMFSRRSRKNNI